MKTKKLLIWVVLGILFGFISVSSAEDWRVPGNFSSIQDAIYDSVVLNGDRIIVGPGNHAGAFVTKGVEIKGEEGAIINSGPPRSGLIQGFRMMAGSEGATISNLSFKVDLAIMNGDAVNNVTITHCTFFDPIQAVSNWRGSSWNISHNEILNLRTKNGGGIGILIGDYNGGTVSDNVVAHNKISGILTSMPNEGGGYNGSGIVLFADYRWGRSGTNSLSFNQVVKNKINLVSKSGKVGVAAFELTDTRNNPIFHVIHDNAIGFNDFRGTALQIVLTPTNSDQFNSISRNFGENRGHGLHPSVFHPDED